MNHIKEQSFSQQSNDDQIILSKDSQNQQVQNEGPPSSFKLKILSEMSSIPGSNLKVKTKVKEYCPSQAIKAVPEEIVFDSVTVQELSQDIKIEKVLLKNLLSVPVEFNVETSQSNSNSNILQMNLFDIDVSPQFLKLQSLESGYIRVQIKPKKGANYLSKLPSKIKEVIFLKNENFKQKIDVTIIPKVKNEESENENEIGSNYTYGGNNESIMSSSRYSLSRSKLGGNAIQKMRSLSKEIKDQKKRGNSQQASQIDELNYHNDQLQTPNITKQIKNGPNLPLAQSLVGNSEKFNAKKMTSSELVINQEEETFRKKERKEIQNLTSAKQNNMTASFNQEELKILENQYNQIHGVNENTIISKNENPFKGLTIAQNTIMKFKEQQKKVFQIGDLEKSQTELRNDLDESEIDEDIQRSNMNDGELNLTDMTHTINETRDPNDQSLRLNQLENSLPLQNHSNFSYSKTNKSLNIAAITNKTEGKFDLTPSYSYQIQGSETSNLDQAQKILSLQNELKTCQKILQQQQSLIQNEKQKRELIQDELAVSKLNNEQSILNKIQELLKEEDPNIEQIMNISMLQERQTQAKKDQQVLQILKQKDNEITELTNELEQAIIKINQNEQKELQLMQQNRQLKIEIDSQKLNSNRFQDSAIDSDLNIKFKNHEFEIQQMQSNYDQLQYQNIQLQNCIQELNQQLTQKDSKLEKQEQENDTLKEKLEFLDYQLQEQNSNLKSDLKSEENRILVREIERLEKENNEIIQRSQEALNDFKKQNFQLQEKLSQSYQDIQRLAVQNNDKIFNQRIKNVENINQQTDIEMHLMDKLIETMSIQMKNEEQRKSSSSIQMEDIYLKPQMNELKLNIVENSSKNSNQQITNSSQMSYIKIMQPEITQTQKQEYEKVISEYQDTIQQLQIQLNQNKNKIDINIEQNGMSYEDLQKHCDYITKQNQKLIVKILDIKDVDDFNQIQINLKDTIDLKVFNPYKTNLEKQNIENKNLEQYQPMLIDKMISENMEIKQELTILKSKHLCKDLEYQQIQQLKNQAQQREAIIKQLKDQINQCEKSFREEIDKKQIHQMEQNEKIAQLNKQYGQIQNENQVYSNLETQNLEKELKLVLNKIYLQYDQVIKLVSSNNNGKDEIEFQLNEIVCKLHNSLQIASRTISNHKKEIYNLQIKIIQQDVFQNAAVINRILANRHYFFITYIKNLQEIIHDKNQQFCKQKDEIVLYFEKIVNQLERDNQSYIQNNDKMIQYEKVISQWQLKAQEFQRVINMKDVEINNLKKNYQKRAEIEYDERQNLRDEKIKSYVDSQVMKYLIQNHQEQEDMFPGEIQNTQAERDTIELTRQFCNLQIQVDQFTNQIQLLQLEKDNQVKKFQEQDNQIKKLQDDLQQSEEQKFEAQLKEQANRTVISQTENEIVKFLKQEMQRLSQNLQQKQQEIDDIKIEQMNQQFQSCFWKFEDALQIIEKDLQTGKAILGEQFMQSNNDYINFGNPLINQELRTQVENFQQQIIDLRTQQIFEIEEIKMNCEIELMEEKKKLQKQQQLINKHQKSNYKQNECNEYEYEIKYYEIYEKNQNLEAQIESLRTELSIIEKKQEEDKFKQFNLQDEIRAYKETIQELKAELCQPINQSKDNKFHQIDEQIHQLQIQRDNSILEQKELQIENQKIKNIKENKTNKKAQGLIKVQKRRDLSNQKEDINQLLRFTNDVFNINPLATNRSFSTITVDNSQNQDQNHQNDLFTFNPPIIIQQLIQAKIKEKQLLIQFEKCAQKELEARQEIKKIFVENSFKPIGDQSNYERELKEEKLRNYDLEKKVRELELKYLIEDQNLQTISENLRDINIEIPNKDYELLANTIIHLINVQYKNENENKKRMRQDDNSKVIEQEQVYKNIIVQLSRKVIQLQHHDSQKNMINQYMPVNPKDQKVWYLELLESQLQSAENMIQKLFDFIKRLQIDIQGSLTSAAQIKATSLDLASNTKNASEEIKLLGYIVQIIRSDIDDANYQNKSINHKNPFQENTIGNSNISMNQKTMFELQSQLSMTLQIKQQLENEIKELKDSILQTQQQNEQEIKKITENNQNLQSKTQKLQKELSEKIDENKLLQKDLKKLKKQINCDEDLQKSSAVKQNQILTSKNILKLQKDMQEWRKINEENLKIKENKLNELKDKYQKQEKEIIKLKAENQMLRKNQKEWLQSSTKQLEDQKQELQRRVNNLESEKEIQTQQWRIEKMKLTQKIEELEESLEDRKGEGLLSKFLKPTGDHDETIVENLLQKEASGEYVELLQKHKKIQKKYNKKSEAIKQKDQDLINMQEEINKLEQICRIKTEEKELQISQFKQQEIECKTLQQTIRQLEYEKKMYQMQRDCLNQNKDQIQTIVHKELDDLRSQFAQLQIEKEAVDIEFDKSKNQELKLKIMVERIKSEIEALNIKHQELMNQQNRKIIDLEAKEAKQQVQIKLLSNENSQFKNDNQIIIQKIQEFENEICEKDQSLKQLQSKYDDKQKKLSQTQNQFERNEETYIKVQQQLEYEIIDKNNKYEQFSQKLIEIIESRNSLSQLYESQIDIMKQKIFNSLIQIQELKDGKPSKDQKDRIDKEIDMIYQVSQRDSTIKTIKKENINLKSQISKIKQLNADLKSELKEQILKFETQIPVQQKRNKKQIVDLKDQENQNNQNQENCNKIDENILEKIKNLNLFQEQILDLQTQISSSECSLKIALTESSYKNELIDELRDQIEQISQKDIRDEQLQKIVQSQTEQIKALRQEFKSQEQELSLVKSTWIDPKKYKAEMESYKELQSIYKNQKDELNRKKELIQNLKYQKESLEKEKNEILNEYNFTKEENQRLLKNSKQQNHQISQVKQYKYDIDLLKKENQDLQNELQSQIDKSKLLKSEIQRKDQILKNSDRPLQIQAQTNKQQQYSDQKDTLELEDLKISLKEQKRQHKLEQQVKENQIRALRSKIEQLQDQINDLQQEIDLYKKDHVDMPLLVSHSQQLEKQLKKESNKIKKYEAVIEQQKEIILKLEVSSQEMSSESQQQCESQQSQSNQNELKKQMYKQSVDILGLSIEELKDFI